MRIRNRTTVTNDMYKSRLRENPAEETQSAETGMLGKKVTSSGAGADCPGNVPCVAAFILGQVIGPGVSPFPVTELPVEKTQMIVPKPERFHWKGQNIRQAEQTRTHTPSCRIYTSKKIVRCVDSQQRT
jgi:hypothetical protein